MSRFRFLALAVALAILASGGLRPPLAKAIFLPPDLEKIPVERLAKNIQEAIDKNPKDTQLVLNLARAHAMAYSLRSDTVEVNKRTPGAVWFGFEPAIVPFNKVAKTEDKEKLKAAKVHLDKALELYEKAAKMSPDDLRIKLGQAWLTEQSGKKEDAIKLYRKLVEEGWAKEKDLKALGFGGHTITGETAGYLVPLLDKEKDKDEIAMLTERAEKLRKLPRPITPIAVPLKDGLTARDLEDRAASVAFDADGTGLRKKWTWINADAAWLVYDPKHSGKVTSALQLFGSVTFWMFWETGYDALSALDDNHDGKLTDKELIGLALWRDVNGNGVSEAGEVKPLPEYGIVSLSCRSERDPNHPDKIAFSKVGVTFQDGKTRPTFDLVLHPAK
jgi:tetratricopeptide (TPR) repeat protein